MKLCTARYWSGWSFFADPQGLFIWLHTLGHNANLPDISRRWVHDATRWFELLSAEEIVQAANEIGIIKDTSDPILLGQNPAILSQIKLKVPDDPTNSYREYISEANKDVREARSYIFNTNESALAVFRQSVLLRMTDIYIAQENLETKIWVDRSHPQVNSKSTCPFAWTPNISHLLWNGEGEIQEEESS